MSQVDASTPTSLASPADLDRLDFAKGNGLLAGILHDGVCTVADVKAAMHDAHIPLREIPVARSGGSRA